MHVAFWALAHRVGESLCVNLIMFFLGHIRAVQRSATWDAVKMTLLRESSIASQSSVTGLMKS